VRIGDAYRIRHSYSYTALTCDAERIYTHGDLVPVVDNLFALLRISLIVSGIVAIIIDVAIGAEVPWIGGGLTALVAAGRMTIGLC